MEIIGEKINGTIERVGRAVTERDAVHIRELATTQVEAGASYLDVNAGTTADREADDLLWLVEVAQGCVDVPMCLDSPNPASLSAAIEIVDQAPMINSINGEADRLAGVLPLVADNDCRVIALAMDGAQIPEDSEGRMRIVRDLIGATRSRGIPDDRVYIDPLAMTIAANSQSASTTLDTIRAIRAEVPEAHVTMGLSNISFGLPARRLVNVPFLTLAMAAGLDSAILDPTDHLVGVTILATDLLLGRDRHAQNYNRAYRAGRLTEPEGQ